MSADNKAAELESSKAIGLPVELTASRKASLIFLIIGCITTVFFVIWALNPDMISLPELAERDSYRRNRGLRGFYMAMANNKAVGLPFLAIFSAYMILHNGLRYFRPASVRADETGLEINRLRGQTFYKWSDVGPFQITKRLDFGYRTRTIGFKNLSRKIPGLVKFPEEFNLKPEELGLLMEACREAAAEEEGLTPAPPASEAANKPEASMISDWQPPSDTDYAIREERAPWGRYALYTVLLGAVAAGGIWLASQVVVNDELPAREARIDLPTEAPSEAPAMGADEAAWVAALELDTLAGYRQYLEEWPEGRFREDAQEQINRFDNEAWATAQQADTIRGYEDYLEAWPEGLHADKARARIAEIKAAEDARQRAIREAAEAEARAWEEAARGNTVESYQTYLDGFPAGKNADEARNRIAALQASAADEAAWASAKAANRAQSYEQYLNAFPQGKYAAEAIAAIERLRPSPGRTFSDCDRCPELMVLAGGNDTLGALDTDDKARANEKPARPVQFAAPFAMSVTEVTFAQYDACVDAGGCTSRPSDNGWGRGSRPVINVAFADAQAYASWLSKETGQRYSLPSEAEWEYAARAGSNDVYPGGSLVALCAFANGANQETSVAWSNAACTDPGVGRTLPTGTLNANAFGLRDMVGNVQEWTLDCNTLNLRDAPVDGSADARGSCGQRAVRGGSWFAGPDDLRFTARQMLRRGDRNDFTGFRVVRRIDG